MRRARPLLGTIVEIGVAGGEERIAIAAIDAAFAAIADVHRTMSAHDAESDVGRMNRTALHAPVRVAGDTWRVLAIARAISAASGGAFDICVAPTLARWGYLPMSAVPRAAGRGDWRAIELLPDFRVRFHAPAAIDLGGIAKGYAVDRAAAVLQGRGVEDFVINAGGDIRVGAAETLVHVRDPACPTRVVPLARIARAAVATSGRYFSARRIGRIRVHPIVDPRHRRAARLSGSVSVFARECALADALTKVVAVRGKASAATLAHFGAEACILSRTKDIRRIDGPCASTQRTAPPVAV